MQINTKYELGQMVYRAREVNKTITNSQTCDLCFGERRINYKGYECKCPKCLGDGKIIIGNEKVKSIEIQKPREITSIRATFSPSGLSVRYRVNGFNVPEEELFLTMEEIEEQFGKDFKNERTGRIN